MPTYEYVCTAGHEFEKFQSMTDKPLKKCPKCRKSVRRLLGSGVGIIFKGSGFYQTDYKSKPSSDGKKGSPDTPKKESAAPSSSGEKKPEAGQKKES